MKSGWEVGPYLNQASDIRDKLEQDARAERERLQNREIIRDITTSIELDATSLVGLDDSFTSFKSILPELSCIALSWDLEKWIDPLQSIFSICTKNRVQHGIGQMDLSISAKHLFRENPTTSTAMTIGLNSVTGSVIYPLYLMTTYQRSLNNWTFMDLSWIIHSGAVKSHHSQNIRQSNIIQRALSIMTWQIGMSRIVSTRSIGNVRWSIGLMPSLALSYKTVLFNSKEFPIMADYDSFLQYGLEISRTRLLDGSVKFNLSLPVNEKVPRISLKGKIGASFVNGIIARISMHRYITEWTTAVMSFSISTLQGIYFKVGVKRDNIKLVVPILLARDNIMTWRTISLTSLITSAIGYFIEKYILDPLQKYEELEQIKELKLMKSDVLFQKKKDALDVIDMMRDMASAKMESERSIHGLVIIQALYGYLESQNESDIHDVVVPLQLLVFNSQLHLPPRSKMYQLGFYDPCFGTLKPRKLSVTYFFRDKLHSLVIDDMEPLSIPRKEHATI